MNDNEKMSEAERLRKQVIYRANHRGIKEMDIILGHYADAHCADMDDDTLERFIAILEESDRDLLTWFTNEVPVPETLDTPLFAEILAFAQSRFEK